MADIIRSFLVGSLVALISVAAGALIGAVLFWGEPLDTMLYKGILVMFAAVGICSMLFAIGVAVRATLEARK